jgi:plasmid stabilization system protein ParE
MSSYSFSDTAVRDVDEICEYIAALLNTGMIQQMCNSYNHR